jgi:hypothetical protein
MTPEQVHYAAQRIFELRETIVPDKAHGSLEQRKAVRKKLEAWKFQRLLALMEKESAFSF